MILPLNSTSPSRESVTSATLSGDTTNPPTRPTSLQLSPGSRTSSSTATSDSQDSNSDQSSATDARPGVTPPIHSQLVPGSGKPPPLPTRPPPGDEPPPLPSQPPPGNSDLQQPAGSGYLPPLPSRPPPGDIPPSRPSCPVPGASRDHHTSASSSQYTDSFQKTDSEYDDKNPKECDQEPIDKWLLERIKTIESSKLDSTITTPGQHILDYSISIASGTLFITWPDNTEIL